MKPLRFALLQALYTSAVLLGACGSAAIHATDYQQGCSVNDDCTVIYVGDPCACRCDTAAIAIVDRARADADRAAIDCGKACSTAGPCQAVTAFCDSGRCAVRPAPIP